MDAGFYGLLDFTGLPVGQPEVAVRRGGSPVVGGRRKKLQEALSWWEYSENERRLRRRVREAKLARESMTANTAVEDAEVNFSGTMAFLLAEV